MERHSYDDLFKVNVVVLNRISFFAKEKYVNVTLRGYANVLLSDTPVAERVTGF
jgi:hypothetical protein